MPISERDASNVLSSREVVSPVPFERGFTGNADVDTNITATLNLLPVRAKMLHQLPVVLGPNVAGLGCWLIWEKAAGSVPMEKGQWG